MQFIALLLDLKYQFQSTGIPVGLGLFFKHKQGKSFHKLILTHTNHADCLFPKALYLKQAWERKNEVLNLGMGLSNWKQRAFLRTCQATLIIHNATNSTYNSENSACSLFYRHLVIQEATKINMMEGMDKAGPVTWHNKGFDLVPTSLPHFSPAKLSNLFSAL